MSTMPNEDNKQVKGVSQQTTVEKQAEKQAESKEEKKKIEEDGGDGGEDEDEEEGMVVTGLEIEVVGDAAMGGCTLESFLMKQMGWIPESPVPILHLVTAHDGGMWPMPAQSVAFMHHHGRVPTADLPAGTQLLRENVFKFQDIVTTYLEQLPPTATRKIGLAWFDGRLTAAQLERALVAISPHLAEGAVFVFERIEMRNKFSHNHHVNVLFEYLVAAKAQHAKFEWIARLGTQVALRSITLPRTTATTTIAATTSK
jgi:hypothetical protein